MEAVIDRSEMERLLARLMKSGPMKRLPKSHKEQKIFVALAASILDPQKTYSEPELNDQLADWLSSFTRAASLDHVTIRRYMVDYGFLLVVTDERVGSDISFIGCNTNPIKLENQFVPVIEHGTQSSP